MTVSQICYCLVDLLFGGSGENSSSFSLPGTNLELGCINNGIKKHGAGDHKNKREKHKCGSVNKDDSDDWQYKSLLHNYL